MLNYWRSEDKTAYLANGDPANNMMMFEDDPAKFDINVVHADYMKVRNIVLAYQLPEQWCRAVGVGSISLRVQMNNVLTWVRNAQGIDPEANDPYTGMPFVKTPKSWTFSLGVTL